MFKKLESGATATVYYVHELTGNMDGGRLLQFQCVIFSSISMQQLTRSEGLLNYVAFRDVTSLMFTLLFSPHHARNNFWLCF
jgi:hypothetical protein